MELYKILIITILIFLLFSRLKPGLYIKFWFVFIAYALVGILFLTSALIEVSGEMLFFAILIVIMATLTFISSMHLLSVYRKENEQYILDKINTAKSGGDL